MGAVQGGAQTTNQSLPSDTAQPYTPGYPFLPESDPFVEMPDIEVAPPMILNDNTSYFEWELRGLIPDKTPADYDRVEGMALPETTPNLSLPVAPDATEEDRQVRDQDRSAYENIFKASEVLGLYRAPRATLPYSVPEPRLVFEKEKARRVRLGPLRGAFEAEGTFNYSTNVSEGRGDTYTTFQPKLYLETGTRGFASLVYMPNFTRFSKYTTLDSQDENFFLHFRYPFSKLQLAADVSYLTQSGLFVNSDGYATARTYLARIYADYPVGRKTDVGVSYQWRDDKSDPGGIAVEHSLVLTTRYRFNEAIALGTIQEVGQVQADFGDHVYQTLQIHAALRPSYHFKIDGRAGFQVRRFSSEVGERNGLVAPVFDITGSYHWNDNTAFVLRAYRTVSTVTFDNMRLDIETGVESYALLRMYGILDFKVQMVAGYTERLSNVAPKTGDYCFLQGGASVSWAVSKMWELMIFNKTQQRFADSAGSDFVSNVTGIGCKLRF
jgi:hypothetical protein